MNSGFDQYTPKQNLDRSSLTQNSSFSRTSPVMPIRIIHSQKIQNSVESITRQANDPFFTPPSILLGKEVPYSEEVSTAILSSQNSSGKKPFSITSIEHKPPVVIAAKTAAKNKSRSFISTSMEKKPSYDQAINHKHLERPRQGSFLDNFTNLPDRLLMLIKGKNPDRQQCPCDSSEPFQTCKNARLWLSYKYQEKDYEDLKSQYEVLSLSDDIEVSNDSVKQIRKDLERTFPTVPFFQPGGRGLMMLERVLTTYAKYDPQIGYVQGMNFLAGSLLYHSEEFVAFWLLVMIIEKFELRDIYLPELPGLSKHMQIMEVLLFQHQKDIYEQLYQNNLRMEFFLPEWIMSLACNIIPLENLTIFFTCILSKGWAFFYSLILEYLRFLEHFIVASGDIDTLLQVLKSQSTSSKRVKDNQMFKIDWKKILETANSTTISRKEITDLHSKFDIHLKRFKIH
eukprot:TRINITY_DN2672_c0_g1_i10.p1 TRINITY_DN2672_c0_g1~~TRINITY_DN2672_c0_g1_i10.p1  ORF type:complete len:455 (+),score=55.26 TRINITY_DN2672_c0_g1_i10:268-1632(+)